MPPAAKTKPAADAIDDALKDIVVDETNASIQPLQGSATVSRDDDTQAIGGAEITGRQLATDPILGRRDAPSGHGNPE
jgi:hypothetical protein